jgi:hypothetical protein
MTLEEIEINLHTTEDGPLPLKVRVLGKSRFLCMRSTDFLASYRVLAGDTFEADLLSDRLYLFRSVVQPSEMLHFKADLGLYVMPHDLKHPLDRETKEKAFKRLGDHISDQFTTPALFDFLKECKGGWELDEFIQCFALTIHVPPSYRDALLASAPSLCTGLRADQLKEIFSGVNE